MVTAHSGTLTNLTGGTTYHYQVCSTDAAQNEGCSADATFVMDVTAPTVARLTVSNRAATRVVVTVAFTV